MLALAADGLLVARVALGAVAPTALLVPAAADALIGSKLDADALAKLAVTPRDSLLPIPQTVIDANLTKKMTQNPGY